MVEIKESVKMFSFRSGMTSRSILAAVYATVVFTPALMYLELVTGQSGFNVSWFTLLLWVKLAELTGTRLKKQEALIVFLMSSIYFLPLFLVYRSWFRQSDIVRMMGFGSEIPDWFAPSPASGIFDLRTIFHPAWIVPISVYFVWWSLAWLLSFGLGYFAREVFVEIEELPFPMQQVNAAAVTTITEGESTSVQTLSVFSTIGFVYGFFLYALPFVIQSWTDQLYFILPIPWFDFNRELESVLPGASFGIATDLLPYVTGIVLPLRSALSLGIGSLAVWTIGNWLIVNYDLSPIPWWVEGMTIQLAAQKSIMNFWATIIIGFSLAAGLAPLLRHPRYLVTAFRHITKPFASRTGRKTDPVSFTKFILMIAVSIVGGIGLYVVLVPNFMQTNPWFVLFIVFMPFISTFVSGRMLGEAGTAIAPQANFQNVMYLSSGYPYADVWFTPSVATVSGHGALNWFKTAQLTETSSSSVFKSFWIVWPVAFVLGLFYVQILWSIAPIPSGRYPGAEIYWPIQATYDSLWIRGREVGLFPPEWILYSFLAGAALYLLQDLLHLPITFAALAVGAGTLIPIGLAIMIGGIVSQLAAKILGKEWWNKNKFIASAGITMGESIAITISVGISLIINSIWLQAY